jgi:raffinose/stachyose/melibiose transport system permease protein
MSSVEVKDQPPKAEARSARTDAKIHKGGRPLRMDGFGLYGLLTVATITALFPIFWLVSGAFQTIDELYSGTSLVPKVLQWSNFIDAWTKGDLATYLTNSIIYTLCAVGGILMISSLAGYALARINFAGKTLFSVIILAVMVIPAPTMFLAQYRLLIEFGLTNSRVGYILILIAAGVPMATLIMRSFFSSQPKELEEAAALDGASSFTIFFRVIMPLARPGLAAVGVIQGLNAWNEYLMALVLFDDDALMPIQRGLTSFVSADAPQQHILLAATTISIVPIIVFYLLAQRHIVKGLGAGATK